MTDWLIDKSALWRLPQSPDYEVWLDRINRGRVRGSLPTRLEVVVSALDPDHWPILHRDLLAPLLEAPHHDLKQWRWRSWVHSSPHVSIERSHCRT